VIAGAAGADLRVPAGTSLAGYGALGRRLIVPDIFGRHPHAFWFRPHQGVLDPIGVRALVLESGDSRLVWVTLDLIAVDRAFTAAVASRLRAAQLPPAVLLLSASHTHSGPGGFLDAGVFGPLSAERHDPVVRDVFAEDVVAVVRRAMDARAPARVAAARVRTPTLTTGRLGHPTDPELVVLKVTAPNGALRAALWNYAIHGTMLGSRNLKLSGDVMGLATRALERELRVPVLFVNGAVGDVSPERHGEVEIQGAARQLATATRAALEAATRAGSAPLRLRTARLELPAPYVSLKNCAGGWVPGALTLPLDNALPRDVELVAGTVGDAAWVTIPGELQTVFGAAIKKSAGAHWAQPFVAGVTNDYLGYFVTARDYARPAYVTCASLYGPDTGARLTAAAEALLAALARGASR
jgi:neutral ceramidase